jgi:hypothetical protein
MAVNPEVYRAVAQTLEGLQAADASTKRAVKPARRRHLRLAA